MTVRQGTRKRVQEENWEDGGEQEKRKQLRGVKEQIVVNICKSLQTVTEKRTMTNKSICYQNPQWSHFMWHWCCKWDVSSRNGSVVATYDDHVGLPMKQHKCRPRRTAGKQCQPRKDWECKKCSLVCPDPGSPWGTLWQDTRDVMGRSRDDGMENLRKEFGSKLWNATRHRSSSDAGGLHTAGIQNATGRSHKFKWGGGVELAGMQQPVQLG